MVGMGYWGKNLVRNFHQLSALYAVCDSSESVETICKREYEGVKFCRDFSAVLSDPAINAVALATPAVTHYEFAKAALEAGKDVFVEKPLAIEVRHGQELVGLAKRHQRILMVGHILCYHPAIVKLQELIRNGVLGRIQCLYSNRLNIANGARVAKFFLAFLFTKRTSYSLRFIKPLHLSLTPGCQDALRRKKS